MHKNTIIIICGPTAVGKTSLAIKTALALNTEIISSDSRQCYKELNIGVAKPSIDELKAVHHHFINSHSINDDVNAGAFESYALKAANKIFDKHQFAVMVGGTGLYIKAFCEGIDNMHAIDPAVRQYVISAFNEKGIEFLQSEIAEIDPAFWAIAERQNPQRLMRALELYLTTGKSVTFFRKGDKKVRSFNIIKIGLDLPRPQLYDQINVRVDKMMEVGLLQEASDLYTLRDLNALQTVGYEELFDFFENKYSLKEAVEKIKMHTRHYAKRQLTWFKKDSEVKWFHPDNVSVEQILSSFNM